MKKILLILSITFLSTQLFAEDSFDNYFSVGYLNSSGNDVKRKGATSGSVDGVHMKGGNGFFIGIGQHLENSPISIELEYMLLKEDFIEWTTKDSAVTHKGSGSIERSGIFITAKRHFESTSVVTPHIGFGIGWQKDDYKNIQNTAGTLSVNDSDSAFNYGFLVGTAFDISKSLQLNLDYKYRNSGEGSLCSIQSGTTTCGTWENYVLSTIALSISKSF